MRPRTLLSLACLLGAASRAAVPARAQSPPDVAPAFQILSPSADAYISGATTLSASLTPANAATRILFFVDGKQVCETVAQPFECSWEAGGSVEHSKGW